MAKSATKEKMITNPNLPKCEGGLYVGMPTKNGEVICDRSSDAKAARGSKGAVVVFVDQATGRHKAVSVTPQQMEEAIELTAVYSSPEPTTYIRLRTNLDSRQQSIAGPAYTISLKGPFNSKNKDIDPAAILVPDGILDPNHPFIIHTPTKDYVLNYGGIAASNDIRQGMFSAYSPESQFAKSALRADEGMQIVQDGSILGKMKFPGTLGNPTNPENINKNLFYSLQDIVKILAKYPSIKTRIHEGKLYITGNNGKSELSFDDLRVADGEFLSTLGLDDVAKVKPGNIRFATMQGLIDILNTIPGVDVQRQISGDWLLRTSDYRDAITTTTHRSYNSVALQEKDWYLKSKPIDANNQVLGATSLTTPFILADPESKFSLKLTGDPSIHKDKHYYYHPNKKDPGYFASAEDLINAINKDEFITAFKCEEGAIRICLVPSSKYRGTAIELNGDSFGLSKHLGITPIPHFLGAATSDGKFARADLGDRFTAYDEFTTATFVYIDERKNTLHQRAEAFKVAREESQREQDLAAVEHIFSAYDNFNANSTELICDEGDMYWLRSRASALRHAQELHKQTKAPELSAEEELQLWLEQNAGQYYEFSSLETLAKAMKKTGFIEAFIKDNSIQFYPTKSAKIGFSDVPQRGNFVKLLGLGNYHTPLLAKAVSEDMFSINYGDEDAHFVYVPGGSAGSIKHPALRKAVVEEDNYFAFATTDDLIKSIEDWLADMPPLEAGIPNPELVTSPYIQKLSFKTYGPTTIIYKNEIGDLASKLRLTDSNAESIAEYFAINKDPQFTGYNPAGPNNLASGIDFYHFLEDGADEPMAPNPIAIVDGLGNKYYTYLVFIKLKPLTWAAEYIAAQPTDFAGNQTQLAAVTINFTGSGALQSVEGDATINTDTEFYGRYVTKLALKPVVSAADPIMITLVWGAPNQRDGITQYAAPNKAIIDITGDEAHFTGFIPANPDGSIIAAPGHAAQLEY